MNILLLEDDKILSETIEDALMDEGYECDAVYTGNEALEFTYKKKYDLYLLDINVPGILGNELLEELRSAGDMTPTVFITSKASNGSVLDGFKKGCDDYIKKPFTLSELRARIQAIFNRVYGFKKNEARISEDIVFNLETFEIHFSSKESVQLKNMEGRLLSFFVKNRGNIISKDDMIEHVWQDKMPSDVVIRVYISTLKKLIGTEAIRTVKGLGYKLEKI